METKQVNSKKFDALMAKNIRLKVCPKCLVSAGDIKIPMGVFGRSKKAYIECCHCGYKTKGISTATQIYDAEEKRYGAPTIEKSLMGAIYRAIEEWNAEKRTDFANAWNRRVNDGT